MPKLLLFSLVLLLFSSCATILHKKSYTLIIKSNGDQVKVGDSVYKIPAKIKVNRSKEDMKVTVIKDSVKKEFTLKSSPDPVYLFANLGWVTVCPVAYLIDLTNSKRFYYGWGVNLNTNDTSSIYRPAAARMFHRFTNRRFLTRAGQINFTTSIPYGNSFYFQPEGEGKKSNSGFFGFSTGAEYYYKPNSFLSLSASVATDFPVPIPVPLDPDPKGSYEAMNAINVSLTGNKKIKRFSIGYGLNFSRNSWNRTDSTHFKSKQNNSIGINLNTYFQINKYFFVGLVYRPSVFRIMPAPAFSYEHMLSVDFVFKAPLRKGTRRRSPVN